MKHALTMIASPRVIRFLTIAVFVFLGSAAVQAQQENAGLWKGYMAPPGFETMNKAWDVEYQIARMGPTWSGRLRWQSGAYVMQQLAMTELSVTFIWMYAGTVMDCQLELLRTGVYSGGCIDQDENVGPMMMTRPGVEPETEDLSIQLAYDVFGIEPEAEVVRVQRVEVENELIDRAVPEGSALDVNGVSLNVVRKGEGPATVVFEAGLGDGLRVWKDVIDEVSALARVVAYDRPGIDYSEAVDDPLSVDGMVGRLRAMLDRSGSKAPYVLVGHDAGGLIVRKFAALYPDEVAGVVLVHPAHEQQRRMWKHLDPETAERDLAAREAFYGALPKAISAEYALFSSIFESGEFEADAPDVPMIVLTGTRVPEEPRWIGETAQARSIVNGLHAGLARQSASGIHREVEDAGIFIQTEQPDAVIQAIRDLVEPLN